MGKGDGNLLMRYSQTGEMTWAWPALAIATTTAVRHKRQVRVADGCVHGNRSLCCVVLILDNMVVRFVPRPTRGRSHESLGSEVEPQIHFEAGLTDDAIRCGQGPDSGEVIAASIPTLQVKSLQVAVRQHHGRSRAQY